MEHGMQALDATSLERMARGLSDIETSLALWIRVGRRDDVTDGARHGVSCHPLCVSCLVCRLEPYSMMSCLDVLIERETKLSCALGFHPGQPTGSDRRVTDPVDIALHK